MARTESCTTWKLALFQCKINGGVSESSKIQCHINWEESFSARHHSSAVGLSQKCNTDKTFKELMQICYFNIQQTFCFIQWHWKHESRWFFPSAWQDPVCSQYHGCSWPGGASSQSGEFYWQQISGLENKIVKNKANLRDLIAATSLVISNRKIFRPCDREIWWITLKNNRALLLYYVKLCASFQTHWLNQNWIYSPEMLNSGRNWWYVIPCDLEIWCMTLKNNRAPLLCYFKLCAAFRSHWWIQTGVTVQKRTIWVKFDEF